MTSVTNSRADKRSGGIWRRRRCESCKAVFTTREVYDLPQNIRVQKHDGRLEPFSRTKMVLSISRSLEHLKSPLNAAEDLADTAINKLLQTKPLPAVLPSSRIAEQILTTLQHYDTPGYVRYLSYRADIRTPQTLRKRLSKH